MSSAIPVGGPNHHWYLWSRESLVPSTTRQSEQRRNAWVCCSRRRVVTTQHAGLSIVTSRPVLHSALVVIQRVSLRTSSNRTTPAVPPIFWRLFLRHNYQLLLLIHYSSGSTNLRSRRTVLSRWNCSRHQVHRRRRHTPLAVVFHTHTSLTAPHTISKATPPL
jgi:hypothetical protein